MRLSLTYCFLFITTFLLISPSIAQETLKTIKVTGGAQRTVVPNEIYGSLSLQEYNDRGAKVEMAAIEQELLEVAMRNGIAIEQIEIENINGYQGYDYESGILFSKSYRIKAGDVATIEKIVNGINGKSLASVTISYFGYSDEAIQKIEGDLRIEAIKDAREEAERVLKELGKELVDIVNIEITPSTDYYSYSEPYEDPSKKSKELPEAKYLSISYYVIATYSFK